MFFYGFWHDVLDLPMVLIDQSKVYSNILLSALQTYFNTNFLSPNIYLEYILLLRMECAVN